MPPSRMALALVAWALPSFALAQTPADPAVEARLGLRANAELGFLAAASHFVRLGADGSRVDYVEDAEQSNLYAFTRLSIDLDVDRRHLVTLLYQPLEIDTRASLARPLRIDGLDFPAGTPTRFRYSFPFFRAGWAYDVLPARARELAFGVALQLRNAALEFESADGRLFRGRYDVGPVPLLRARGRFPVATEGFFAFEVDGFYAPISVINGSDNEVVGAIVDASLRFGWRVIPHVETFVNVRYLGGGASGAGDPTPTSDGQQSNWLHFVTLSLGATLDSRR